MELVVYFGYKNIEKPIIRVIDNGKNQVVLAFIPFNGEHLTLHLEKDGSILRTYWGMNKPKSTWDDLRAANARALGFKNPERHGQYYIHEPLHKISNMAGYPLCGRRVHISQAPEDKEKYKKMSKVAIDTPRDNCMIKFFLSTSDNPYTPRTDPNFPTSLGEVFVAFEK